MKRKYIFGCIMIFVGFGLIIYALISAIIFRFQNIDMTELRLFIENPMPTIVAIIGYVVACIGMAFIKL